MAGLKISASLLAADFGRFREEIQHIEAAGADWAHFDIMDGKYVPNLTFGPPLVKALRPYSKLQFDAHLMVSQPEGLISPLVEAGVNWITFPGELALDWAKIAQRLRQEHVKFGLSLALESPTSLVIPYLELVDLVLVMAVPLGFGGQKFQPQALKTVNALFQARKGSKPSRNFQISVDGGVNAVNVDSIRLVGADVVVSGSYIFGHPGYREAISQLKMRPP